MNTVLKRLFEQEKLNENESREILTEIASGVHNRSHIASFLSVFLMRSISVEELRGFRNALLDLAVKADLSDFETIDLCGTGGDGKHTFNISTLASFVVAGTGQKVAKHGNYGVSSISGSSNIMEHFGYKFTVDESKLKSQVEKANICFLHAPLFHPAMKTVAPVRKELGMKTIFNLLGPLVNPSMPKSQLVGVFDYYVLQLYGELFKDLDIKHCIVHSVDGYDEVSLTSVTEIIRNNVYNTISAKDMNLPNYDHSDLFGGTGIEDSAIIFKSVLEGNGTKAQNDVVIANSAFALMTAQDLTFNEAYDKAKISLSSGKALNSFKTLIEMSN